MIVSSFSEKGFEEYGKRFIEGFLSHWEDEALTVYVEGEKTVEAIGEAFSNPRLTVHNLLNDPDFLKFATLLGKSDPIYRGRVRNPSTGEEVYNFRYDAFKFFRKVWAVTDYARVQSEDLDAPENMIKERPPIAPFAWLDADVVFLKKIPRNFLRDLLAGHEMVYLGRPNMYPETGFVGWDPSGSTFEFFMKLYRETYASGAFRLLTEWHDCQVLEFCRVVLDVPTRNIAKGCDPNHPFVYSTLGTYMDHLKGDRKQLGRSPEGQSHAA